MSTLNVVLIVLVALAAIALVVFMIVKNKSDRKEILPAEGADPMEEEKIVLERKKDLI